MAMSYIRDFIAKPREDRLALRQAAEASGAGPNAMEISSSA